MTPITLADFRARLTTEPLEQLVQEYVLGGEPFVFSDDPEDYELLSLDLSDSLSLTPADLTIVGSAKCGFSLNPASFGRTFRDDSDIDVVVVDPGRFDRVWHALVDWDYQLGMQQGWRKQWQKRRREEVYWGWFLDEALHQDRARRLPLPFALRSVRDISNEWFEAFQSVGLRHPRLAGRKFSGRLYRTWQHALSYHVYGLQQIRLSLQS